MGLLRKEQKKLTRKQIKESAIKLMIQRGLLNTQIHDICKEANVAPGTFYVHFSNKEEILKELIEDFNSVVKKSVISNWPKFLTNNFKAILESVADTYIKELNGQRDLLIILSGTNEVSLPIKLLSEGINPKLRYFVSKKIKSISSSDKISSDYIDYVVHALASVWIGVGVKYALSENKLKSEEVKKILVGSTIGIVTQLVSQSAAFFKN
jgi:hypothetical protein